MNLDSATTPVAGVLDVPTGWRQGKGAYGGFVIASMMRAADAAIGDPARPIRSVTAEIPAPVGTGRAELHVDVLRGGRSVTTARVALVQDGETRAHAVVVAAAPRDAAATWNTLVAPDAPAWDTLAPLPWSPAMAEFAQHFELRIVDGIPLSGGSQALGWIRAREPGTRRDPAFVAALIDAWFPCAFIRMRTMRPMATIAFTLELVHDVGDLGDEPLLYRASSPVCSDGYAFETRELWRADGRLVARNHQTFVIIK